MITTNETHMIVKLVCFTSVSLFWIFALSSQASGSVSSSQQRILETLLAQPHDSDAMPWDKSKAVLVSYGAKLVRIIDLKERDNTIRSQWWIYQLWLNPDLAWRQADFNNTNVIHLSPKRIWTPDIVLYNSADDNDELGGGTEKYKTKVAVNSSGFCTWMAPAIFKSTCDINTEYFPFDDQASYAVVSDFISHPMISLTPSDGNHLSEPCKSGKKCTIDEARCEENGNSGSCRENDRRLSTQRNRRRTQSSLPETPILNDHLSDNHSDKYTDEESFGIQTSSHLKDWQTAAKIIDRVVLFLGLLISIATFLAIFLQAPRVREMFYV